MYSSGSGKIGRLIHAGQVRQSIENDKSMVLVDVRPPAVYRQYRVPGSLNIPLPLVRTKRFLADKVVILINNGFQRDLLISESARLESSGFKNVSVMAGGITAWRRIGGRIEGDSAASHRSNMVSPLDFHAGRQRGGLVIVNASGEELAGRELPAKTVDIPFNHEDPQPFRDQVTATAVPHSKTGLPDLLVLSQTGEEYPEIENLLADLGVNIFFLEGGIAAYRDFLKKRENLKNPQTVVSGGGSCPVCPAP